MDCAEWPQFDREAYEDVITRNLTIALLILDEGRRQIMFRERFDFGEEITGMARVIIGRAGE